MTSGVVTRWWPRSAWAGRTCWVVDVLGAVGVAVVAWAGAVASAGAEKAAQVIPEAMTRVLTMPPTLGSPGGLRATAP